MSILDAALALSRKPASPQYEAELYWIKGKWLLVRAVQPHAKAEACARQARDLNHRQRAKSWEIRAEIRLSGLWSGQVTRAKACELLAEIDGWFT